MNAVDIIGFGFALVTGVTMGIIGGGGSILTVPIFVYLFAIEPVTATAYSLFVVGTTALVGAGKSIRQQHVNYHIAIVFAIPSFIAVYLTRKFIVPAIPSELVEIGAVQITKDMAILILFGVIMVLAAIHMIRDGKKDNKQLRGVKLNYPLIFIEGFGVGVLTGLVGAGGGFLIIPALVILARLPMRLAIGTSLLIIAVKSLAGFVGDIGTELDIAWGFLLSFTGLSIIGIFLGNYLSRFISGSSLKKGFGWFVLLMGSTIIIIELVGSTM